MKLNIGNGKPAEKKPETTLQEKVGGHQFALPKTGTQEKQKIQTPTPVVSDKTIEKKPLQFGSQTNNGNGDSVQGAVGNTQSATENVAAKSTPVPEISDERFNLVVGAEPALTEESATQFKGMIEMLASCIDGDEHSLQNVLKGTLEHLAENPELDAILTPEDRQVFVRAARSSYGITLVAKTTRKARTTKASAKVDELMDELADLDFTL